MLSVALLLLGGLLQASTMAGCVMIIPQGGSLLLLDGCLLAIHLLIPLSIHMYFTSAAPRQTSQNTYHGWLCNGHPYGMLLSYTAVAVLGLDYELGVVVITACQGK